MSPKTIAIASDHGGFEMKTILKEELAKRDVAVIDLGTDGPGSVDYPDFAAAMAKAIRDKRAEAGVLICGSGIGISIAANRYPEVRAALVHDAYTARMSRLHNDANVLCLGGRIIGIEIAKDCLDVFLNTEFEGGRHARRVEKLGNPA